MADGALNARELECGCIEYDAQVPGMPGAVVLEVDLDCPAHGPMTEALLNRQPDPWDGENG